MRGQEIHMQFSFMLNKEISKGDVTDSVLSKNSNSILSTRARYHLARQTLLIHTLTSPRSPVAVPSSKMSPHNKPSDTVLISTLKFIDLARAFKIETCKYIMCGNLLYNQKYRFLSTCSLIDLHTS